MKRQATLHRVTAYDLLIVLGGFAEEPIGRHGRHGAMWTAADDAVLAKLWGKRKPKDIAAILDRDPDCVTVRACLKRRVEGEAKWPLQRRNTAAELARKAARRRNTEPQHANA